MSAAGTYEDNRERLQLARELAIDAGKLARDLRTKGLQIQTKGTQDFVTQADKQVEELIISKLGAAYPDDGFLGEEGGNISGESGVWIIDPIDGTSNYMKGLDHWSISIAYMRDNSLELGCVYAPDRDQVFEAATGLGSHLNGKLLRREPSQPNRIIFGLGISGRVDFAQYLDLLKHLDDNGIEHRRFGSAALSIAEVAANRLDGYFEPHLNIWDAAAGLVIARQAGADVLGFEKNESFQNGDRVYVAASGLRNYFDL
jgi:myo-inositol-1(or 4)-monophosphatase